MEMEMEMWTRQGAFLTFGENKHTNVTVADRLIVMDIVNILS